MSQDKHLHKRTHYFIKKDFQFKFILKFCLLIFAGAFISTGLLFLFSHDTLTSSFQHSRLTIQNTAIAILPAVIYTNLITLGLICMAAIVVILFISHKIAGPIFRFEKEIKEIGQGDLTKKIRLRKKDQITELAESIDNMTASLHEKVLDIRTGLERLLKLASKQNAPQGLIEELGRLKQKIENNFNT